MTHDTSRSAHRRTAKGFTLVEVIIVVLIISVLAAIAYPAYQDSVVKSRRAAAKACIAEATQFLERFYTTNNLTYVGGPAAWPGCAAGTDVTNHYTVTPVAAAATAAARSTYTVTATPKGLQLTKDTQCGTLSVNTLGVKTETGTETGDYCW
jgi:type IV pilus assembly protein PilE